MFSTEESPESQIAVLGTKSSTNRIRHLRGRPQNGGTERFTTVSSPNEPLRARDSFTDPYWRTVRGRPHRECIRSRDRREIRSRSVAFPWPSRCMRTELRVTIHLAMRIPPPNCSRAFRPFAKNVAVNLESVSKLYLCCPGSCPILGLPVWAAGTGSKSEKTNVGDAIEKLSMGTGDAQLPAALA